MKQHRSRSGDGAEGKSEVEAAETLKLKQSRSRREVGVEVAETSELKQSRSKREAKSQQSQNRSEVGVEARWKQKRSRS